MTLGGGPTVPWSANGSATRAQRLPVDHRPTCPNKRFMNRCHTSKPVIICTAANTARGPDRARTFRRGGVRPAIPGPLHLHTTRAAHSEQLAGFPSSSRPMPLRSWPGKAGLPADELTATVSVSTHSPGPVSTGTTTAGKCLRSLLRRPEQQAQSEPRRGRPPALLWRQDGSGHRDQGLHPQSSTDVLCGTTAASSTAFTLQARQCPSMDTTPVRGGTISRYATFVTRRRCTLPIRRADTHRLGRRAGCTATARRILLDQYRCAALPVGTGRRL